MLKNISELSSAYNLVKNITNILKDYNLDFSYVVFYQKRKISIGILIKSRDVKKITNFIENIIISEGGNILSFVKLEGDYLKKLIKLIGYDREYYTVCEESSFINLLNSLVILIRSKEGGNENEKENNSVRKEYKEDEKPLDESNYQIRFNSLEKIFEMEFDRIIFLEFSNNMLKIFQKNQVIKWHLTGIHIY